MAMRGGGDFSDMRDTFVSYLLTIIVTRTDNQRKAMLEVSKVITSVGYLLMRNTRATKNEIRVRLAKLTESKITEAISVIAGDEQSMIYFIIKADDLSYQLMRPSPRMNRTRQMYEDFKFAWRVACGYHLHHWEEILQMNSALILQEVPLIKTKGTGMNEFMGKMRSVFGKGKEEIKK